MPALIFSAVFKAIHGQCSCLCSSSQSMPPPGTAAPLSHALGWGRGGALEELPAAARNTERELVPKVGSPAGAQPH